MGLILGIDTSNYTTSLCAVDADQGELRAEVRRLLPVQHGQRGLRQAEALFFHVRRLPELMAELMNQLSLSKNSHLWAGVGVSVRPRPLSNSYMPSFAAGESFAQTFASALGLPVLRSSHQEGHLAAAEYFLPEIEDLFIGVHLSGGTSDVLVARRTVWGYAITPFGEGIDLHAGQFVDRVGVSMGLPFPAGPHLERLAMLSENSTKFRLPSHVKGACMSFSGPCTAALRAESNGVPHSVLARAVEDCLVNSLLKAIVFVHAKVPEVNNCIVVGGVSANIHLRDRLRHRLVIQAPELKVLFAPPAYSSDNALGVATLAYRFFHSF